MSSVVLDLVNFDLPLHSQELRLVLSEILVSDERWLLLNHFRGVRLVLTDDFLADLICSDASNPLVTPLPLLLELGTRSHQELVWPHRGPPAHLRQLLLVSLHGKLLLLV